MNTNRYKNGLIFGVLVCICLTCAPSSFAVNCDEAFQAYVAAYNTYQDLVKNNAPKAELDKAVKAYAEAKEAYEAVVGIPEKTQSEALSSGQNRQIPEETISEPVNIRANKVDAFEVRDFPKAVIASKRVNGKKCSDVQRYLSASIKGMPKDAEKLVNELCKTTDAKRAEELIGALENKLQRPKYTKFAEEIKYQIAYNLDRLGTNKAKAAKIFNELLKSKNTDIAQLAKLSLDYAKGKRLKAQWHNSLRATNSLLNTKFNSYKQSSWLAFPVKIVKGARYLGSSVSFINLQNNYEKFQLNFEAVQALFVDSVASVFDSFQQTCSDSENEAYIRLVYNNYEAWYSRWKLLNAAKSTLDVQYFIIDTDVFGLSLLGTLAKKAREGVKVRLMVDTRGSNKLSLAFIRKSYLKELAKLPNVEVKLYNTIQSNLVGLFTDVRRVVSSNHDKILIADGQYCIVGGRNICDEYLVDPIDDKEAWRDCDVVIKSPEICSQLKVAFDDEFNTLKAFDVKGSKLGLTARRALQMQLAHDAMNAALYRKGFVTAAGRYSKEKSMVKKLNKQLVKYRHMTGYQSFKLLDGCYCCPVHVLDSNSLTGPNNDITDNIVKYIDACRREIIIQNPYIVLTPRAYAALQRASKRGVPIFIYTNTPQTSDSKPTEAMLYADWRKILTDMPTARLYGRFNAGQLHAKNFVFDSEIGVVGTYNFDYLSEKVNSEVVAAVKSEGFANELRTEIFNDSDSGVEYHLAVGNMKEFGPGDVEGARNMWAIRVLSKMGWLKPLF